MTDDLCVITIENDVYEIDSKQKSLILDIIHHAPADLVLISSKTREEIATLTFTETEYNALVKASLEDFIATALRRALDRYEDEHLVDEP